MAATKCLYCDMLLTRQERAEGWCDSCGKRLPPAALDRSAYTNAPRVDALAPRQRMTVGLFFAIFGLALVFGLIGAVVAGVLSAGMFARTGGIAGAVFGSAVARSLFASKRPDQA